MECFIATLPWSHTKVLPCKFIGPCHGTMQRSCHEVPTATLPWSHAEDKMSPGKGDMAVLSRPWHGAMQRGCPSRSYRDLAMEPCRGVAALRMFVLQKNLKLDVLPWDGNKVSDEGAKAWARRLKQTSSRS